MGEKSRLDFGDSPENSLMHSAAAAKKPDFSGWATKFGLRCSDGRTIMPGAFKHQDTERVPLVWQHGHQSPENVLGHAILEDRDEGTYCYGFFNETASGKHAKGMVQHEDISALSIYANKLIEKGKQVSHGMIREVSLVMAGANPGALIDNVEVVHSDGDVATIVDEAIIYTGLELEHDDMSDDEPKNDDAEVEETEVDDAAAHADKGTEDELDPDEVYEAMTPEQKEIVHYFVGVALADTDDKNDNETDTSDTEEVAHNDKDENTMGRNVFEQERDTDKEIRHVLSHDAMKGIAEDAVKGGSFKEAVQDYAFKHGIDNIDTLFPDARNITDTPEWDKRRTEWVADVLNSVKKNPFSRIKSVVADLTHAEARAKGYIKGTMKKEEFFGLTKRITTPATIYKKQKLDRDDITDITDFDVVMWLKGEMRLMLDEEIARAILIGDGRDIDDDDKVRDPKGATDGAGIRSILHDDDLYAATITVDVDGDLRSTDLVDKILESMRFYKGSGVPTFYTTLPVMTQMLLARDTQGRRFYRTASDLAAELGVAKVVAVEVMEDEPDLVGIIVNLQDYTVGADRGGEVSFFDDFDIDFNQYKYLIEARSSGALTKIRSALVIKQAADGTVKVVPAEPTFDPETSAITIVNTTGVTYRRSDTNAAVTAGGSPYVVPEGVDLTIYAVPNAGYFFENNVEEEFTFRGVATS